MDKVIYEGYNVWADGRITCAFGQEVNETYDAGGYAMIHIGNAGRFGRRKHRFIYEAFNGPIADGLQIDHVDNDRTNNAIDNLVAMTPSENSKKSWQTSPDRVFNRSGVIQYDFKGIEVARYNTLRDAAEAVGGYHQRISEVARGLKDSHRGFNWVYIDEEVV